MTSRLETLLRQRELLREHLRWLDAEIAAVGSSADASRASAPPEVTSEISPTPTGPAPASASMATRGLGGPARFPVSDPGEIAALEHLPDLDKSSIHDEVKRGCLLYAALAFAGFAAVIAAAYWMR